MRARRIVGRSCGPGSVRQDERQVAGQHARAQRGQRLPAPGELQQQQARDAPDRRGQLRLHKQRKEGQPGQHGQGPGRDARQPRPLRQPDDEAEKRQRGLRQPQAVLDAALRRDIVVIPARGKQIAGLFEHARPRRELLGDVPRADIARLRQRGQPEGRAERQAEQPHERGPAQEAPARRLVRCARKHEQQRPRDQRGRGQQHGQVMREHEARGRRAAPEDRPPHRRRVAAAGRPADAQQREQEQRQPDERQVLGQRAAHPRIRQAVRRPRVGDRGQRAAPSAEQLARKEVHRDRGEDQPRGQRPLERGDEPCAEPMKEQAEVIAERRVEVEDREAVAEALLRLPARAGVPGPQRAIQAEQAEDMVRAVVRLLEARLPHRLQRGHGQQDDEQERPYRGQPSPPSARSQARAHVAHRPAARAAPGKGRSALPSGVSSGNAYTVASARASAASASAGMRYASRITCPPRQRSVL
ncbi:MAG: hypothetical protein BWY52_03017 [Chloroflexi bacterium ADurb.Bin325]|nr:MAG: hypothetical protein BWY52_03017 [Chloroflexi bacterium ADurb.Bin325]